VPHTQRERKRERERERDEKLRRVQKEGKGMNKIRGVVSD